MGLEKEEMPVILTKIGEPVHIQWDNALKKDITGTNRNNNKLTKANLPHLRRHLFLKVTLKSNEKKNVLVTYKRRKF